MTRGPEPAVSGADLECIPGPCRFCRSGWQWWLWGKGWLRKVAPCPGLGLLPPHPGLPREEAGPSPLGATHHRGSTTWGTVSGTSGTWLQHLRAPGKRGRGQGWRPPEPGQAGASVGRPGPHSSPAGASQCGRGTAPGHCLPGPPRCPVARLEDREAVSSWLHPSPGPAPQRPLPTPSATHKPL